MQGMPLINPFIKSLLITNRVQADRQPTR